MRRRMTALLGLAGFLGMQATVWGQTTYTWDNSNGGSFHSASNWLPGGGPPGSQDTAIFQIATAYTTSFFNVNNAASSGHFEVHRGTVTFTSGNPVASHSWGNFMPGDQINLVGPTSNHLVSSSTLILTNMPNGMDGELLVIGHAPGKTGTMNISNAGWTSSNSTTVGFVSAGNLNITSTGVQESYLISNFMQIGEAAGSLGTVNVSGANARIVANSVFMGVGGTGGRGVMTVSNGSLAQFANVIMGDPTTEGSSITVTGANSRMLIGNNLQIASGTGSSDSIGSLTVLNGGLVTTGGRIDLGSASASHTGLSKGTITVSDANSMLVIREALSIGRQDQGDVFVQNGGRLEASQIRIGELAGSTGRLDIFNTAASIQTSSLFVGQQGTGNVTVSNTGVLTTNDITYIGFAIGSQGNVNILANSSWTATAIFIGENGSGRLVVDGALALVTSQNMHVGGSSGAESTGTELGALIVQNQGRLVNSQNLSLGYTNRDHSISVTTNGVLQSEVLSIGLGNIQGRGRLNIASGGQVISNGGTLANDIGTNATVVINGISSNWNATGTNALDIGRSGIGVLNVEHGATLNAGNGTLGTLATGTGTLNLTGLNSATSFTGTLGVGGTSTAGGGTGVIHINSTTTLIVAGQLSLWSGGTINLNGGTLNVGAINFNAGNWNWTTGTVNYSQSTTLSNNLLNNLIGTAHHITENKTLGSTAGTDLTLATGLTINGGRLAGGGSLTIGAQSNLTIKNGGVASAQGSTSIAGNVIVDDGGTFSPAGVVTNNGSLQLTGPSALMTGGTIDNRGSIRGTGVINNTLSNNTTGQVRVASGDWLTFNGTGHANLGSVQLLGGVLEFSSFLNTGTQGFISGHGTLLTSSAAQGGLGLVNTGTFAFSGGNTNIYGDVQNNAGGRIVTSGGSVTTFHDDVLHNGAEIRTSPGAYSVFFGSVSGASPYTGSGLVQFEGDLRPGNSPADVNFAGDVAFSVTSRLVTEIGGLLAGREHDRLTIQGQLDLGGLLDVPLINGFTPVAGDRFTIIDNLGQNRVNGTFLGLPEGSSFVSGGQLWNITYQGGTGNDVMLMAVPEPTTWAMMGLATLGTGGAWWYRRRQQQVCQEQEVPSSS